MKKIELEYKKEYGKIPRNETARFSHLMSKLNINSRMSSAIFDRINTISNIEWKHYDFTIYLVPKATPRPRHSIITNTFYVSGAKDNKDIFRKSISNLDIELITTPCKFTCISYLPIPKSMSKVETMLAEMGFIRPISKPDFDNLAKTYSDMIQGTLLYDDSLIIEGVSKKFYSAKPRVEIHIEYMEQHDSIYNETKMRKKV